jgi:hypothetical protein
MRWPLIALLVVLAATFPQLTLSVITEPLVWAFGGGLAVGARRAQLRRWFR